ncbi:MAG: hypothetical protein J6R40_05570 [Clostridia bacterium]|nr:hypothetical protein [Clostridia bacterium]
MSKTASLYLRSIAVVVGICLVMGLLLAICYKITAPIIADKELKKQQAALYELFPEASGFDDLTNGDLPETVTSLFKTKEGDGFVAYLQTNTQYGTSSFAVGIDAQTLKITEIKEITYGDSIHFGADYLPSFVGKDEGGLSDIASSASPAKITRSAVKNAVVDLLLYLEDIAKDPNVPTPDPEELAQLFPNASAFIKVEEGAKPTSMTALYKTAEGDGFVAFFKTSHEYGNSEYALAVDAQTNKVLQILIVRYGDSYDVREKDPAFLPSLIGKGVEELSEISTSATPPITKAAIKSAIIDVLTYLESLGGSN